MSSTSAAVIAIAAVLCATPGSAQGHEVGVGVVQPPLDPERPLYFYGTPLPGADPVTATPVDSVTFAAGEHFVGIETAPPWFVPEGLKLDYDLLWLRARTLTQAWIEVEVNARDPRPRSTPETAWIAREGVSFRPWAEFLLEVYSVEALDPESNPIRTNPHPNAEATGESSGRPLRPLAVRGNWLRVEAADGTEANRATGWVRWRGDGVLLVSFSMLS